MSEDPGQVERTRMMAEALAAQWHVAMEAAYEAGIAEGERRAAGGDVT